MVQTIRYERMSKFNRETRVEPKQTAAGNRRRSRQLKQSNVEKTGHWRYDRNTHIDELRYNNAWSTTSLKRIKQNRITASTITDSTVSIKTDKQTKNMKSLQSNGHCNCNVLITSRNAAEITGLKMQQRKLVTALLTSSEKPHSFC